MKVRGLGLRVQFERHGVSDRRNRACRAVHGKVTFGAETSDCMSNGSLELGCC